MAALANAVRTTLPATARPTVKETSPAAVRRAAVSVAMMASLAAACATVRPVVASAVPEEFAA
nr:MAG TPA: hypothetical protein [Inoviridae sp.]